MDAGLSFVGEVRVMKTVARCLAIGLLSFSAGAIAAPPQEIVAKLGDPPRLEVHGAETFKADEIRGQLLADVDVANACYPATSIGELCSLITSKTREAYLYAGFAEVKVAAAPSAEGDRIELTIVEGRRYLAGEVVIEGTQNIDARTLEQDLTVEPAAIDGPTTNSGRTLWPTGKPAWLHGSAAKLLREAVDDRLLERGISGAHYVLEIVPDPERACATLVIRFSDEGSPAVLGAIEASGNKKNTTEDVLAFLALRPGMPYLGELDKLAQRKLWESGRFTKSNVKLVKPTNAGEPLKLVITLVEYEKAPPLKRELSREEAALVKLGCWLNRFHDSDEEVVLKCENDGDIFETVVAAKRGIITQIRTTEDRKSQVPFALAFVLTDERIGLYSTASRRKIEGVPTPGRLHGNLKITFHNGPAKLTGQGTLNCGMALSSRSKTHDHYDVRLDGSPVSMLSLAHEYGSKMSWDDDLLTVAYCDKTLSLNGVGGQLVRQITSADGGTFAITRTNGEFERLQKEIGSVTADYAEGDYADRPLAAALELYCDTGLAYLTRKDDAADRKYLSALRKLTTLGLLAPFDRMVTAACHAQDEEFFVPDDRTDTSFWTADDQANWPAFKYLLGQLGIRHAHFITGRTSWLARVWREAMFAMTGKSRHLEQELVKHLSAVDSGPVRHLIIGELLAANGMQAMARVFGLAGETRLSADGFRHDYSAIVDGGGFLGDCLSSWADALRYLDNAEVGDLCDGLVEDGIFGADEARVFADVARQLHRDREAPLAQAVANALDTWWRIALAGYVKSELRALAVGPRTNTGADLLAGPNGWRYRWHGRRWWYYSRSGAWQYWNGRSWRNYSYMTARRVRRRR